MAQALAGASRRPRFWPLGLAMSDTSSSNSCAALYPAITACLCGSRRPGREEIRVVASRIWREGFQLRFGMGASKASFATRRLLVRAALAALVGGGSAKAGRRVLPHWQR